MYSKFQVQLEENGGDSHKTKLSQTETSSLWPMIKGLSQVKSSHESCIHYRVLADTVFYRRWFSTRVKLSSHKQ